MTVHREGNPRGQAVPIPHLFEDAGNPLITEVGDGAIPGVIVHQCRNAQNERKGQKRARRKKKSSPCLLLRRVLTPEQIQEYRSGKENFCAIAEGEGEPQSRQQGTRTVGQQEMQRRRFAQNGKAKRQRPCRAVCQIGPEPRAKKDERGQRQAAREPGLIAGGEEEQKIGDARRKDGDNPTNGFIGKGPGR